MGKITHVRKRNGDIAPFDPQRIRIAVGKAFQSVGNDNIYLVQEISDETVNVINNKFDGRGMPTVEEIQDIVEIMLIHNNLPQIAKNYILYRYERQRIREQEILQDQLHEEANQPFGGMRI